MMLVVRRLRWLLFFSNGERTRIRQGLRVRRDDNHELLKELG